MNVSEQVMIFNTVIMLRQYQNAYDLRCGEYIYEHC